MLQAIRDFINRDEFAVLRQYWSQGVQYYTRLSTREQLLIKLAVGVLTLWLIYDLVYQSFRQHHTELVLVHQQAVEDYEWLESQQERLSGLLAQRGVQREGLDDVEQLLGQHIQGASVNYQPDGVIEVIWRGNSAENFFKAINSLINKGASLNLLEFERTNNPQQSDFKAQLKV